MFLNLVFFFGNLLYLCRTPPLELNPESIKRFRDVVSDASSQAVIDCLNDCNGNAEHAIQYFYEVYSLKVLAECLS